MRAAAQVASALSRPTVGAVDAALAARGRGTDAIEATVAAGVLERRGNRLAFAHPLLATVAYQLLTPEERRALHACVAGILDEPEERARHLALAADEPDAAVATALDAAARRAAARGAPDAAADLLEQARRLTPAEDDDERRRRGIEAAERHFEAGEVGHARTLLEEIVDDSPPRRWPGARTPTARLGLRARGGLQRGGRRLLRRAAPSRPTTSGSASRSSRARVVPALDAQRRPDALEYARSALQLAEQLGEPTVLADALALVAFLETLGGEGVALETIERAMALGEALRRGRPRTLGQPVGSRNAGRLVSALTAARDTYGPRCIRGRWTAATSTRCRSCSSRSRASSS